MLVSLPAPRFRDVQDSSDSVPELAAEVGIRSFAESDAETAYGCRCGLAHGQGLASFTGSERALYCKMESVLREILKRTMLDRQFADVFSNDSAIRTDWPICP